MLLSGLPPLVREGDRFRATFTVRNASAARRSNVALDRARRRGGAARRRRTSTLAPGQARELDWDVDVPPTATQPRTGRSTPPSASDATARRADALKVAQKVVPAVPERTYQATIFQLDAAAVDRGAAARRCDPRPRRRQRADAGEARRRTARRARLPARRIRISCFEQRASIAIGLRDRARWDALMGALPDYLDRDGLAQVLAGPARRRRRADRVRAVDRQRGGLRDSRPRAQSHGAGADRLRRRPHRALLRAADRRPRDPQGRRARSACRGARSRSTPKWLDSITIEPNLWPTSAVIDWYLVLKRQPKLPRHDERIAGGRAGPALAPELPGHDDGLLDREARRAVVAHDLRGLATPTSCCVALNDVPAWKDDMPRLVRGSLGRMQHGHWNTTVANAWGVLALAKFSARFEADARHRHDDRDARRRVVRARVEARRRRRRRSRRSSRGRTARANVDARAGRHGRAVGHAAEHRGDSARRSRCRAATASRARSRRSSSRRRTSGSAATSRASRSTVDAQSDMTWVVVDDPLPAGSTALGRGLGGDSDASPRRASAAQGTVWPAFEERTFTAYPRVLPLRAEGPLRHRVHGAPQQPGHVQPAGDARRGDVRAGDVRRGPERGVERCSRDARRASLALAFVARCAIAAALPSFDDVRAAYVTSDARARRPPRRAGRRTCASTRACAGSRGRRSPTSRRRCRPRSSRARTSASTSTHGVDWPGLAVAAWDSAWRAADGRRPRGGSTLTMQLAGLLDPALRTSGGEPRTLAQKWDQIEAARALERAWTKAQILEAYLNLVVVSRRSDRACAPRRSGLFGKAPSGLDARESAILVALLRAPGARPRVVAQRACAVAAAAVARRRLRGDPRARARSRCPGGYRLSRAPAARAASRGEARSRRRASSVVTTLDARRAGIRDRDAARPPGRARRRAAWRTARSSCSTTRPATCSPTSAAAASCRARRRSTAWSRRARPARRSSRSCTRCAIDERVLTAASLVDDSPLAIATARGVYVPQNYDRDFRGTRQRAHRARQLAQRAGGAHARARRRRALARRRCARSASTR